MTNGDGAILTVVISGTEAEEWHEKMLANRYDANLDYGPITYKIHLDEEGNMEKIEYSYQYEAELEDLPGANFKYDVVGTITITEIGTTVINAPVDASEYAEVDFITSTTQE